MFLPFQKHLLISELPKEIVIEKLNSITDENVLIRTKSTSKKFEGWINNNSFSISRIINYRNSYLPIIKGNFISQNNNSTLIEIKMQMNMFATIFMSIWFLVSGGIFLSVLFSQVESKKFEANSIIIILGFLIFGYLIMILGFNYEAKKSKEILIENL